jgi:hypothetical protein
VPNLIATVCRVLIMNASPGGDESTRSLSDHFFNWSTALMLGACVAGGLLLTMMVIGTTPQTLVSALPAVDPGPAAPVTEVPATDVPTSVGVAETPTDSLAPGVDPTVAATPAPEAELTASNTPLGPPAPVAAAPQAAPTAPAPAPIGAAAPVVVQPRATVSNPTPGVAQTTSPATTNAPTTQPATTQPATTQLATTSPPAQAVTASYTYPSYSAGSAGSVTLRFDGSSVTVWSVSAQANWVYQIDVNGPRSVEVKFFNVQTHAEAEFHAQVEGGRIKLG